jgi:hypothetical protein
MINKRNKNIFIIVSIIFLIILILLVVFKKKSEKYTKSHSKVNLKIPNPRHLSDYTNMNLKMDNPKHLSDYTNMNLKMDNPTSLEYLINVAKDGNKLSLEDYKIISKRQLEYLESHDINMAKNIINSNKSLKNLKIEPSDLTNDDIIGNINDFSDGLTDLGASMGKDIFQKLFKGNKQSWRDLAIDASIQTGIIAVSLTLTCLGFGFANPLLNMFSPYNFRGQFPIDIEKVPFTISEELLKQSLGFCNDDINKTIIYYNNIYLTAKLQINTNVICNLNNTQSENLECIKDPSFDPNIVQFSSDINAKHKRTILTEMLINPGTPPYVMFNTSNYSFEFISSNFDKNIQLSVELYKAYKLITGLEITYYQELALADTYVKGGVFINPWESRYIGDKRVLGQQIAGTLLGQLQIRCQKLFDMIRKLMKMYYRNLYWLKICHGNQATKGPDDTEFKPNISFSCKIYTTYYYLEDRNDVIEDSDYHHARLQVTKEEAEGGDFVKADINIKAKYLSIFYIYLRYPLENLQQLKKMAGIKYLKGEQNYLKVNPDGLYNFYYDAVGKSYETNNQVIYDDDRGYPFGLKSSSYSESENIKKDPLKYKTPEQTIKFKNYCTPSIPINMRQACSDLKYRIDATIFNGDSADKKYTNTMICDGNSYQSCLLPGMSPGDKTGNYTNQSRTAFCIDDNFKAYPLIDNRGLCINENIINSYDVSGVFETFMKIKHPYYDFSMFMILDIGAYKQKEENVTAYISIYDSGKENKFEYVNMDDNYKAYYRFDPENEYGLEFIYEGVMIIIMKGEIIERRIPINFTFKVYQNYMKEKELDIISTKFIPKPTTLAPMTLRPGVFPETLRPGVFPETLRPAVFPETLRPGVFPETLRPVTYKPINSYDISELFQTYIGQNYLYDFKGYDIFFNIDDYNQKDTNTNTSIKFNLKSGAKNLYEILYIDPEYKCYYSSGGLDITYQANMILKVIDSPFSAKKIPVNFYFKVFKYYIKEIKLNITCLKI